MDKIKREISHFVYKTTNIKNGKFYIGVHSTTDIDDGYLGSGKLIKMAIKKYGKENFKREILYFFKSLSECYEKEKELVTQTFLEKSDTYNICVGGKGGRYGMITAKDKDGNIYTVFVGDERIKNGELFGIAKNTVNVINKNGDIFKVDKDDKRISDGSLEKHTPFKNKVPVRDGNGNTYQVDRETFKNSTTLQHVTKGTVTVKDANNAYFNIPINDPRLLSKELVPVTTGLVSAKDRNGDTYHVDRDDIRLKNGDLVGVVKGTVVVKDKNGNLFRVSVEDPRYISGELTHPSKGRVLVKDSLGNKLSCCKDDPRYISGELVGINKGLMYITNGIVNKKINKNDPIPNGFKKGKIKYI